MGFDPIPSLDIVLSLIEIIRPGAFGDANVQDARHFNEFTQEMYVVDCPTSTRHCPVPILVELIHFGV